MAKGKKGRQYQDTVFRMYFNEETRLKEVAGALHGRSYAEEPLQIVTLDGTFLSQIKNDISFLLAGRNLIFLEHQSTANQNMPLRCLYYVCEQLRQYIPAKKLYQNTPIKLPAPEFHVFYTGNSDMPETCQMKLSDAYKKMGEVYCTQGCGHAERRDGVKPWQNTVPMKMIPGKANPFSCTDPEARNCRCV